jgi:hypothetical protein
VTLGVSEDARRAVRIGLKFLGGKVSYALFGGSRAFQLGSAGEFVLFGHVDGWMTVSEIMWTGGDGGNGRGA